MYKSHKIPFNINYFLSFLFNVLIILVSFLSLFQGKLIQLFGRQLAIKQRCNTTEKSECSDEVQQFPNLKKWLHVLDVRPPQLQVGKMEGKERCETGCN